MPRQTPAKGKLNYESVLLFEAFDVMKRSFRMRVREMAGLERGIMFSVYLGNLIASNLVIHV